MKRNLYFIIFTVILIFSSIACKTTKEEVREQKTGNARLMERIANRETPPVYKDWNNYPDIEGLDKYQLISKFTLSWESIDTKGGGGSKNPKSGAVLGLQWDRTKSEYPGLSKTLINIEEAKKNYDMIHQLNPNIMLGVEIRWDALQEFELPANHKFWKRDIKGNRIPYAQKSPPRYEVKEKDPAYLKWLGERCKAILDTGVVDFIFFDHIGYMINHKGDPLPAMKAVRKAAGPDAILIGNTHFMMLKDICNYIDAWGENETVSGRDNAIRFWETNGRPQPKFNCWEFFGPKDNLKMMRYFTTLVMTNTNASLRYIDHTGTTKPSPWYDFWDVKIGKFKGSLFMLSECFAREYTNGTTVCNNSGETRKITFNELRERASTGEKAKEFTLEKKDGDMFLYVK